MKHSNRLFLYISIVMPLLLATQSSPQQVCTFAGAGSTAAAPYYADVISQFNPLFPQSLFTYNPNGSGTGVAQFLAGTVQYAGTDNFLTNV